MECPGALVLDNAAGVFGGFGASNDAGKGRDRDGRFEIARIDPAADTAAFGRDKAGHGQSSRPERAAGGPLSQATGRRGTPHRLGRRRVGRNRQAMAPGSRWLPRIAERDASAGHEFRRTVRDRLGLESGRLAALQLGGRSPRLRHREAVRVSSGPGRAPLAGHSLGHCVGRPGRSADRGALQDRAGSGRGRRGSRSDRANPLSLGQGPAAAQAGRAAGHRAGLWRACLRIGTFAS